MKSSKKVRYAVVGLGHIAQVAVLPAFRQSKNSELIAVVSGDATKRRLISRRYGVEHVYSYKEYDACLHSGLVDAVYIALPNQLHEEYTTRALNAGIHVLCEKPLAVSATAGEVMTNTARRLGVQLMVAYRLHFDALNLDAIEIAHSGKIGAPVYFTSEFGYRLKEGNIRSRPEEGGSPLHDIGIYCINAARAIFKDEPTEVFAMAANPTTHPARIYQTVTATLRFPKERVATFTCSFSSAPISNYRIVGTHGDLFIENAYEYVGERIQTLTVDEKKRTRSSKAGDQFAPELEYFSNCLLTGKEPEPSGLHGLADLQIIEALLESIETGQALTIKGLLPKLKQRPNASLKIKRPPHRKPPLVHAESASK